MTSPAPQDLAVGDRGPGTPVWAAIAGLDDWGSGNRVRCAHPGGLCGPIASPSRPVPGRRGRSPRRHGRNHPRLGRGGSPGQHGGRCAGTRPGRGAGRDAAEQPTRRSPADWFLGSSRWRRVHRPAAHPVGVPTRPGAGPSPRGQQAKAGTGQRGAARALEWQARRGQRRQGQRLVSCPPPMRLAEWACLAHPAVAYRLDDQAAPPTTGYLQAAASPDSEPLHRNLLEASRTRELEIAPPYAASSAPKGLGGDLTGLPEGPFRWWRLPLRRSASVSGGSGSPQVALPPPPILFECARPAWRPPVPVVPVVVQPRLVGLKALGALAGHPLLVVVGWEHGRHSGQHHDTSTTRQATFCGQPERGQQPT
jgi:hypothetical protein